MKQLFLFLIIFIISCSYKDDEKGLLLLSKKIAKEFDKKLLHQYCEWGVTPRGVEMWHNQNFNIIYRPNADSVWFKVFLGNSFFVKFPQNFKFQLDTTQNLSVLYKEIKGEYFVYFKDTLSFKTQKNLLFKKRNPLEEIRRLSNVKNRYHIILINNFCEKNKIEFYLTAQHILTFYFNGHNQKISNNNEIQIINNNWILRKLNEPIDLT